MAAGTALRITGRGRPDDPAVDFQQLYRQQWWPMVRLAMTLVDDVGSAEDVVQDAFSAMYRRLDRLRDSSTATAYLRTAVVNTARSVLRRRRVARRHLSEITAEHVEGADRSSLLSAEQAVIRGALRGLPDRQREVLTLKYIGGLTDPDIARTLGIAEGSVRSAASRGLAALRTALGGQL